MPSLSAYHLTWVSLTLDVENPSRLLQQCEAAAPYFGHGAALLLHQAATIPAGKNPLEELD